MPLHNLKITIHEWTPDEVEKNEAFYSTLRGIWDSMTPWYKLEAPFSESGALSFRNSMKFGGDGWPAAKRLDDIAYNVPFPSRSGHDELYLRVFQPRQQTTAPKGVYLHFHGGGWVLGAADGEDEILHRIAEKTGYTVASCEYRLAPRYTHPLPVEDCIDGALFILQNEEKFGPLRVIGGESAGGHLTMAVTMALRDQGYDMKAQLDCLVLNYGCYDLSGTPSSRNFADTLVLSSEDMRHFHRAFVPAAANAQDLQRAAISPLFNPDFTNLPPAIFVLGSDDALYDDSLFAATKWHMAGNEAEIIVFPGSKHGFCRMGGPDCSAGLEAGEAFVQKHDRTVKF